MHEHPSLGSNQEAGQPPRINNFLAVWWWEVFTLLAERRGRARANLGDTTCTPIRVADLGGRILKWPKSDEKLRSAKT